MTAADIAKSLVTEILGAPLPPRDEDEKARIQEKQGGHHLPPDPDDAPPLDDTDRNTDKVIKPSQSKRPS